jgi:Tol biopolymer transport system component
MPLAPGSRIGSHVVLSLIGEGGMGEVYRARDTTLDRDVAIKRLPDGVANNPERLARFEREAKALAALNHPNVGQIYAVEAGTLVMELVPGSPLRGPLPLQTVLDYASQIASALEAAHDKGIVHRDLKPGNVMVTPDGVIKVLDFGLAARDVAAPPSDPSQSPTLTAPISAGVILGTAAYMAPEQASGKLVDKRADIFSFGVVIWELLTGRRMFEGETVSHVLAAVLTDEPDLTAVPVSVRHLLSRCLEKDPRKRLRDIGDAMSLVLPATDVVAAAPPRSRRMVSLAGWAVAVVLGGVALTTWSRSPVIESSGVPVVRFSIARALDLYAQTASAFALSPDGLTLAYFDAAEDGRYALLLRTLATGDVTELAGASRVFGPRPDSLAWSPDGRQLVRAIQGGISVIDVATGAARQVCDCRAGGLALRQDGTVLLGGFGSAAGIRRVSPGDRERDAITTPRSDQGELDRLPLFLPDGKRFLFTRTSAGADAIYLGSLDGGDVMKLGDGSPRAIVATPEGGHLLIGIDRSGAWFRTFNVDSATITGEARSLVPGAASISLSQNGVLASSAAGTRPRTIPTWFDRTGAVQGTVGTGGYFESVTLSNDGRLLAVAEGVSGGQGRHDIWALDAVTGSKSRLTFYDGNDSTPVVSPDRRRLIYSSIRNNRAQLFQRSTDGTGDEAPLFEHDGDAYPNDWSSDGRSILYTVGSALDPTANDLWVAPWMGGDVGARVPYLVGPGRQQQARFSPDGQFVAFGSDESGTFEIYVQPFPDASEGKWMVSAGGGTEPRWSRDGTELFYFSGQALMAVPVQRSPSLSFGTPVKLFDAPIPSGYTNESDVWQVAPDGRRFLFLPLAGPQAAPPLNVIVNWPVLRKN